MKATMEKRAIARHPASAKAVRRVKCKAKAKESTPKPAVISSVSAEPKKKKDKRPWRKLKPLLKPGQPHGNAKLDDDIEAKICELVKSGSTWMNAAKLCNVSLAAIEDWRNKGAVMPGTRYALFLERVEVAMLERERVHVAFIASDPDWKARRWLLMNWHPDRYKDRWLQEISGPNGGEIPMPVAQSPFVVNITMAAEPSQPAPEFQIRPYEKIGGNGDGSRA